MDHQPRPGICPKKGGRDRLIRLAATHPDWALGFEDETWWSRLAHPSMHTWTQAGQPLRLVEQAAPSQDPDPKALACYGLLVRGGDSAEQVWLRFVDGRPVSAVTIQFISWCCERLEAMGKRALLLVWDNASWHTSRALRDWVRDHNRWVKWKGKGIHVLTCFLPSKSPWLNPIEPRWAHSKRRIVEANGRLAAWELAERVCASFGCTHEPHLSLTEQVA